VVMIPGAPKLSDMPTNEPVPEGVYYIRCDKSSLKKTGPNSKTPGTPMAEVQFTIFGPDEAEASHGRKIFENFMLAGAGMFRVRQFLESAGKDEDYTLEDTDDLLTLECAAVVAVEPAREIDGKKLGARNSISRFMPIG